MTSIQRRTARLPSRLRTASSAAAPMGAMGLLLALVACGPRVSDSPSGADTPAARELQAEAPRFEGPGCPKIAEIRKAAPEFSDGQEVGLFEFDMPDFALAGGEGDAPVTSSCTAVMGLAIPAGVAVRLIGGDWSGSAELATPGTVHVQREYALAGSAPVARDIDLDPSFKGTFFFKDDLRDQLPSPDAGWTPCSAEPARQLIRAGVTLRATGNGTTTKMFFGRVFKFEQRSCSDPGSAAPAAAEPAANP